MSGFEGWAIVEIMGHRRLAGHVSEVTIAGAQMLRIDVPGKTGADPVKATQYYGGSSIFCLTPTTEEVARKEANPPEWAPTPFQLTSGGADDFDDDPSDGDE